MVLIATFCLWLLFIYTCSHLIKYMKYDRPTKYKSNTSCWMHWNVMTPQNAAATSLECYDHAECRVFWPPMTSMECRIVWPPMTLLLYKCGHTAKMSIFKRRWYPIQVNTWLIEMHIREVCSKKKKWVLLTCSLDLLPDI